MSHIDNGVYIIISGRGGRQLATTIDKTPGSAVNILPETGNPGEQDVRDLLCKNVWTLA